MYITDRHAVWRGDIGDAQTIASLLIAFNTEFGDPAPSPADLAERVTALIAAADTVILLGSFGSGSTATTGRPIDAPDTADGRDAPGQIDGLAVLRFRLAIWSPGLECYLAELYVVPQRRGQGLGRALMIAAMDLAREEGSDTMDLGTGEDDTAARALYESLGFTNREGGTGSVNHFYEIDLSKRPD
jgi:ribosomal protein S18 acetylase RimI-like enzyme